MASQPQSPPAKTTPPPPQNSTPTPPTPDSSPRLSMPFVPSSSQSQPEKTNPLTPPPETYTLPLPPPHEISTPPHPPPSDHFTLPPPPRSPPNKTQPPSEKPSPATSPSQSLALVVQPDYLTINTQSNPNPNMHNNESSNVTIGSLLAMRDLSMLKAPPAMPLRVRFKEMMQVELGFRVLAMVLCVISFSLMAADSLPGWDGDSFNRYGEYIYLLSINVIGCTYSLFQVIDQVHQMRNKIHFISRPIGFCFNLAMDQTLAYLLLSASSAATSQNTIWVSRFGADNFTKMVNASVSISFLAFFVMALSSVLSAHSLFSSVS